MKSTFFLYTVIGVFCMLAGCNNKNGKPGGQSAPATSQQPAADTVPGGNSGNSDNFSKVAFVDTKDIGFTSDVSKKYRDYGFEVFDKSDFYRFYEYFDTIFKPGKSGALIKNYNPFPFSIYEMYNTVQHDLGLKNPTTVTGGSSAVSKTNIFRIYPAIDITTKMFYLVLLKELRQAGNKRHTELTANYYAIHDKKLVLLTDKVKANNDIKNFQTIWNGISDPAHPNYKFAACESMCFTISDYDQLLSNVAPFWDLDACKSDISRNNIVIMLMPVIDFHKVNDVRFKLVAIPHRKVGESYTPVFGKDFFDNMLPCPTHCPDNEIK